MISLIRTGRLNGISLGDSLDDCLTAFGKPDDEAVSKRVRILRYGPVQISFNRSSKIDSDCSVRLISTYFQSLVEESPSWLNKEEFDKLRILSPEGFLALLDSLGMNAQLNSSLTFPGQLTYSVGEQLTAVFSEEEDNGHALLDSLQLAG